MPSLSRLYEQLHETTTCLLEAQDAVAEGKTWAERHVANLSVDRDRIEVAIERELAQAGRLVGRFVASPHGCEVAT